MSNLLSSTELAGIISGFNSIHETFCRSIIVYKEPIKTLQNVNTGEFLYGFGENQVQNAYSYTEVTGVYPATIKYNDPQGVNIDLNNDMKAYISNGGVVVKVKKDARDFIVSGKTEKFVMDQRTFTLESEDTKHTFLNDGFYLFKLKATK